MKPVMKDGKRQARREKYLAGGVTSVTWKDKTVHKGAPFTPQDIARIQHDIKVLKERLGKG